MTTILISILVLGLLSLIFGAILGYASSRFKVQDETIIKYIDEILPQSQCAQCGYVGCKQYAEAISNNGEMINKCGPGGEATMLKLASLLNIEPQYLNKVFETVLPERKLARIDEFNCIGCTKCIHSCPVDAIVGAPRVMHTVLINICTGCMLCVSGCPTKCINIQPISTSSLNWKSNLKSIPVYII